MSNDLQKQNDLAHALLQKVEQINALWCDCPTEEELNELLAVRMNVAASLEHAREISNSADFFDLDELQELAQAASSLAANLDRAEQTGLSDDFPKFDELQEFVQEAAHLQPNLNLKEED
jgi:hypothetical protein